MEKRGARLLQCDAFAGTSLNKCRWWSQFKYAESLLQLKEGIHFREVLGTAAI
jgi:hypothetical protein